ncbi:putative spermidine synthase [Prochlorococcus marinus subsp. pastoris str. CCMP1986]|uniref:Polyamine aminopropyltransferase n=1 Tax=Prochlorococcus marinus subsp. pastoris (strain CCMP1986 / NIES-2087 / MED4) TaxID=59919 RepID=SPEE_PROMP|nr:polyamine aminopropyltransferase [Prochlorococcus marinus]Q7UZI0.1 RecName: Full=Polyamine aminopropyltransferase; AltName: Full=Putrescine aminopropyltransferase; Short=PAPT; AltName: Full=Spermidine synthase; Short=SPDS; Short=SPDSY [Prochlorococcus marinus subsp. pastoris str. CCMP1986]KGF86932.1 Spermidine synthase [Prochlorococcus marinus str. EQPAC1]CAE20144.1 putative spermidine synthase [Prochlorococcus marinus subsp. pastoris str. CCMP1986]
MKDMPTWIDEYHKGSRFGLNGKVLLKKNSKYQEILIIETDFYGKALMLDGCWMTSVRDEKYYHECLVHPALSSIDKKSHILIIGGGDGGTARECLKYSQVSKIDLVEIDEEVIKVSKTFLKEIGGGAWSDKRLAIHIDDGVKWVETTKDNSYDVIFIDCSDPSEFSNLLFTDSFYKECKRILTKKGILATQSESPESFENIHIHILKSLNKIFKLSETMYSFVPIYPSGIWSWTFASDEELNLSKVNYKEVMEIENNCDVWNLNFQNAAFKMMPNKIVKKLNS